jgi:hypothetical protein
MNDYEYENGVEVITNTKCVECGDKLTGWETTLCCICEAMSE